jgi:hypothetical protein
LDSAAGLLSGVDAAGAESSPHPANAAAIVMQRSAAVILFTDCFMGIPPVSNLITIYKQNCIFCKFILLNSSVNVNTKSRYLAELYNQSYDSCAY